MQTESATGALPADALPETGAEGREGRSHVWAQCPLILPMHGLGPMHVN
jgi:hypothetical protein